MKQTPVIVSLTRSETNTLFEWVKQEGWNPGIHDASTIYKAAKGGLLGIKLDDELIGVSAVFNHNHAFAYFGLYIIKPEFRGQGYGIAMTRRRLQLAGYRNIALDGVMEHYHTYRKIGFRLAHRTPRYVSKQAISFTPSGSVKNLANVTLVGLLDYENQLFPGHREAYLKAWITQEDATGYCYLEDKKIKGYGLIRPCINGYKVGPLFADRQDIAHQLYSALLSTAEGQPVYCDIPESNETALQLSEELGGKVTNFESARMYRGYQPSLDHSRIYGLTSLEAG